MTNNIITPHKASEHLHRLRHPRIADAIDDFRLMLAAGDSASLLLGCGPSGVGKTTLGDYLVEAELKTQEAVMQEHPGFVPAIRIEAPASGERDFSWRLFYQRILSALDGDLQLPRTTYGVDPHTGRVFRDHGPQLNRLSGLRTAVERSLRARGTRFVVVDEAVHIMHQCHPSRLEQQLNTLRSLSNDCGVQWILLGSYDLFSMVTLSGQLARRTHVIHFSRYRQDVEDDARAFRGCLKKFGEWMPALKGLDLLAYADVFHANTLGCAGTLRNVLERLNLLVAARGWSEERLRSALQTDAAVTRILKEINDGEEQIAPGLSRQFQRSHAVANRRSVA